MKLEYWEKVQAAATKTDYDPNDGDWGEVFKYCNPAGNPVTRQVRHDYNQDMVEFAVAAVNGENDGPNWVGLFLMKDGTYLTIRAGCDYTGWDCQAGGSAEWSNTREEAIACLSDDERADLGLKCP